MAEYLPVPSPHETDEFTVVSWNILLDYTKSKLAPSEKKYVADQKDRLPGHIEQLRQLPELGIALDVVCLQEVQGKRDGTRATNGERIATGLGFTESYWFNHNTSRRHGEYIGMFGNRVENAEKINTRHDKLAVLTRVGEVAVAGIHNRFELVGPMRTHQTKDLLAALESDEQGVIMGDLNAAGWEKPNRLIKRAGFVSVFNLLGELEPKTHPAEAFRDIFYNPVKKLAVPHGTASDRIYVRGCEVLDAGVFESEVADHRGVWAIIKAA